jgi:hypothetical protein
MSRNGITIYANEQGWTLEIGPKFVQVRNPDEEYVTGWDIEDLPSIEYLTRGA